jgi:hypothetical protein
MKSKKNRKTIKHIHHKMNSIKYIKRKTNSKTIKNKKYTRGGAAIFAKIGAKVGGKAVGKAVGAIAKKAIGQIKSQGQTPPSPDQTPPDQPPSTPDEAPSTTSSRQGASLMKSAMSLKKFTPAGMMLKSFSGDKDIKYYFKKGMYALYKVMSSLVTLPIRNLNEVIPPELCKQTTDNNFVCSQSLIQYLLTGSKEDYKKILIDSDKKDCLELEEDGNKIVKCKKPLLGGQKIQAQLGGGNIVIGCNKNEKNPVFKKNDRVIVLDNTQNENASHIVLDDKKWFIGTVTRLIHLKNNYIVQIDNGSELTIPYTVDTDKMKNYINDWNEFYKEFYNMPKVVLQDMYDIGYKIGHPVIEKINKIMKIIYNKSGIYKIVEIFTFLSKNIWQCYSMLLKMDETNVLVVAIKKLVETYKEKKYGGKKLNTMVIFNSMIMIYEKVSKGITVEQILGELDSHINRVKAAIGKKLIIIQERLLKFNIFLRKYACPMNKLKSLIDNINNKDLLEKMLEALNSLLDENNYEQMTGDEKENRINRIKSCDGIYNYDLSITPDTTYMEFDIDPEKEQPKCKSCSNAWAEVVVRYGCFLSKALHGNKNNMTYILINIVQDMATINGSNDPIIESITDILKNIECRSNLRTVISNRIEKINNQQKDIGKHSDPLQEN